MMRRTIQFLAVAAAVGGLLLAACGDPLIAEADRQREAWAGQEVASYRLTVERRSFTHPDAWGPFVSTVRDGSAIEVVHQGTGEVVDDEGFLTGLPVTVEQLFDVIEEFADADSIEVRYDPDLGYPSAIEIDPEEGAEDDELSYFVRGFEPQG